MLQVGQIVGERYRIGGLLGAGGMGEVYEATHVLTEHAVAIKLLRHISDADASLARPDLALEAKIDARVGSPHIVRVQDAGVDDVTGASYLVMELLSGSTLERLIRSHPDGRLPLGQALEILRQVALGLDAAHACAVVHRDLKPENVFVTTDHKVKILDFGIAKILDASNHVTRELRGTPYYMAPEQAKGEMVSPQTDVWALGLITYRALSGRVYWRCANAGHGRAPALAEVVYELTVSELVAPSVRLAESSIHVDVPPGFDPWFTSCVARDPLARFRSAGAAVRALEEVFAGFPAGVLSMAEQRPSIRASTAPLTQPTRTYDAPSPVADDTLATAAAVSLDRFAPFRRWHVLALAALATASAGAAWLLVTRTEGLGTGSETSTPETSPSAASSTPSRTPSAAPALDTPNVLPIAASPSQDPPPSNPEPAQHRRAPGVSTPSRALRPAPRRALPAPPAARSSVTARPPRPAPSSELGLAEVTQSAPSPSLPPASPPPLDPYGLTPSQLFGQKPRQGEAPGAQLQGVQREAERSSSAGSPAVTAPSVSTHSPTSR